MIITQNKKKEKNFSENNLPIQYTDKPVSNNVMFSYLEDFKDAVGLPKLIKEYLGIYNTLKGDNSKYPVSGIIDYMIDAIILGYSRFMHMEQLRNDKAYCALKNSNTMPSEKVCRDMLSLLPDKAAETLRELNRALLQMMADGESPREVALDFDDTVVSVFGNQERADIGYNPKYHGRPSFKEKVCVIGDTKEIAGLTLEEGSHHSNYKFLEFFKQCQEKLPKKWIIKRIRADRGFFDQKNLTYFEDNNYEYVIKAKMTSSVRKIVNWVVAHPKEYYWSEVPGHDIFHAAEINVPLPGWERSRRFVIVRKTLPETLENGQLIFDECRYEYQVIVTNIDYMTPPETFNEYNQRCTVETVIDEMKNGFAFSENSQLNYHCNELFLLIKMIAFNIHNWFKNTILPENMRNHRITTLRRILYSVAGILCGNGWYRRIKLQTNSISMNIIIYIRQQLCNLRMRALKQGV